MNADLQEALGAVAMACWSDVLEAHPHLFEWHAVSVTEDEHALVMLLCSIERLVESLEVVAGRTPETPVASDLLDDIPF